MVFVLERANGFVDDLFGFKRSRNDHDGVQCLQVDELPYYNGLWGFLDSFGDI